MQNASEEKWGKFRLKEAKLFLNLAALQLIPPNEWHANVDASEH